VTVATTSNRNDYSGNGVTVAFAYTFKILAQGDIEVYVDGTLQTLTTHYSVSGVAAAGGGTITFVTAPPSGDAVALIRNAAFTQSVDLVNNDRFDADTLEGSLDRLTMLCQQVKDLATRAIRFAATSTHAAAGVVFPDLVAGKYVRVNDDCDGFELVELTESGVYADPITTRGDLLIGNSSGVAARLPIGTVNKVLVSDGTDPGYSSTLAGLTLTSPTLTTPTITGAVLSCDSFFKVGTETTAIAKLHGTLHVNYTAAPTTGTSEQDLMSYSLPANTLNAERRGVRITAYFSVAVNGNNKTAKLKFGGTTIANTAAIALNGGIIRLQAEVYRTGAATQLATSHGFSNADVLNAEITTPAETLSGAITIKTTGTTPSASGDLTCRSLVVEAI
jgi:hypothetical protein